MPIVGSEFENIVGRELGEIVCTFVPPCNRIIIVSKFAFNFPHSLLGKQFFFFMFGFAQIVDCQYLGLNILHYCKPEVFYKTWRIKNHFAFSVRAVPKN